MKRTHWIFVAIALLITAALMFTVWNKRWWIARAVKKWALKTTTLDDGSTTIDSDSSSWRLEWLLSQPIRRLKELYDTGTLK